MLEQIFRTIFITSCIGAVLTLLLMLIKPLTQKCFSSRWHYYIWLVVLAVMILPVSFRLTGEPWHSRVTSEVVSEMSETELPETVGSSISGDTKIARIIEKPVEGLYGSVETAGKTAFNRLDIISPIWAITAVLLVLLRLIRYALFLIKINRDTKLLSCPEIKGFTDKNITVRISDTICSPLMTGIIKPTLILPKGISGEEQLHNILAHEITHFKRRDVWYKWFVSIVKCIHWFNPAIYVADREIERECEISCDLEVVKEMSREQEIGYINTILSLLSLRKSKTIPLTTGMAGSKKALKERFMRIKNKRKISKAAAVISIIAAIAIFAGAIAISGVLNGRYEEATPGNNEIAVDKVTGNKANLLLSLYEDGKVDLMMIISLDKESQSIYGASIPANKELETDSESRTITDLISGDNAEKDVIDAVRKEYSVPINYYVSTDINTISDITNESSRILFGNSTQIYDTIVDAYITARAKDGTMSELKSVYEKVKKSLTKEKLLNIATVYAENAGKIKTNCSLSDISEIAQNIAGVERVDICLISGDYEDFENGVLSIDNENGRAYILQQMR